jgi:hypothetical protein
MTALVVLSPSCPGGPEALVRRNERKFENVLVSLSKLMKNKQVIRIV